MAIYRQEHANEEPTLDLGERARFRDPERLVRELKMENEALLLFLWVGSGALRRVRGRSSQVKGACSVAARGRCAPPWTCEPRRPLRAVACGQAGACPT